MSEAANATAGRPGGLPHQRSGLGRLAVGLGCLSILLVVLGALLAKAGMVGSLQGFMISTLGAGLAALIGLAVGLVALLRAVLAKPRLGLRGPSIAVALCGLLVALFVSWGMSASGQPLIHDIATDWRDPLTPSAALTQARPAGSNLIEAVPPALKGKAFAGQTFAQVNARTCPGATAVIRAEPVDQAFTRVRDAARGMGLKIVSDDVRQGRLEATATSGWFNFKDDVIVRVRPENAGSRIDIRSVSRQGVSDLGVNCHRVSQLRQRLAG